MRPVSIVVVGASVRGTALVERLVASVGELLDDTPLTIHVVDPHPPGSGRIWRAGQPQSLVMNTVAAQSTVFTDATVQCDGPIRPGPSLAQWCESVAADAQLAATLPPEVADEARRTVGWSNPSRLLYGHYLRWCWEQVVASAPAAVTIRHVSQLANDIRPGADGSHDVVLADGAVIRADAVVLALGWLPRQASAEEWASDVVHVAAGNPIDQTVDRIAPGSAVAVRGVGMSLFDVLSLVTESRGGRFTEAGYEPSGLEPTLYVGSRRGLPYLAKPDFGAAPYFPEQRRLKGAIPGLLETRRHRQLDFRTDIWPLILADAHHDHLVALARTRPGALAVALDRVLAPLARLVPGTQAFDDVVAEAVPDASLRLDIAAVENPLAASAGGAQPIDERVAAIVRADCEQAALGHDSPIKVALHSIQAARGAVVPLVSDGGLTPSSFRGDYQRYLAFAAYLGSGPPLFRSRQLLAAHAAGLARFIGPGIRVATVDGQLSVWGSEAPTPIPVDSVVDARLDAPTVTATADPLLSSLVGQGRVRPWQHSDGTPSDSLDIDPADGTLLDADGRRSEGLLAVGVPLEDRRAFTIIAPVPGTNSSVLRELDAAARGALRAARSVRESAHHDIGRTA